MNFHPRAGVVHDFAAITIIIGIINSHAGINPFSIGPGFPCSNAAGTPGVNMIVKWVKLVVSALALICLSFVSQSPLFHTFSSLPEQYSYKIQVFREVLTCVIVRLPSRDRVIVSVYFFALIRCGDAEAGDLLPSSTTLSSYYSTCDTCTILESWMD